MQLSVSVRVAFIHFGIIFNRLFFDTYRKRAQARHTSRLMQLNQQAAILRRFLHLLRFRFLYALILLLLVPSS